MCLQVPPLLGIYLGAYFRGKYIDNANTNTASPEGQMDVD